MRWGERWRCFIHILHSRIWSHFKYEKPGTLNCAGMVSLYNLLPLFACVLAQRNRVEYFHLLYTFLGLLISISCNSILISVSSDAYYWQKYHPKFVFPGVFKSILLIWCYLLKRLHAFQQPGVRNVCVGRSSLRESLNLLCKCVVLLSPRLKTDRKTQSFHFLCLAAWYLGFGCHTEADAAVSHLTQHCHMRKASACSPVQMPRAT